MRWLAIVGLAIAGAGQSIAQAPTHPRLVGYFPQWGFYESPQYLVKNLVTARGAAMLDQVNYAQGFVKDGHCSVADPNADLNFAFSAEQSVDGLPDTPAQPLKGNFNQIVKLKERYPRLKVIISLEGRAADFSRDAQPENRQAFVASCVNTFIKGNVANGVQALALFDGIDIDWEYPHTADSENFVALLKEFRHQLDAVKPGLMLNIAVGPAPEMSGAKGGDLSEVGSLVNEVGLMTYDFTGPWSQRTGFVAPFSAPGSGPNGDVQQSVKAYLKAGIPAAKLIVGVPFYGYGWRLVPEENHGLYQEGEPIRGDRPFSYITGLIAKSTVYRQDGSGDPWLFDGDAFWTYEDATSVKRKADYAVEHNLGGLMIWELSNDTPDGELLGAAYAGLHAAKTLNVVAGQ